MASLAFEHGPVAHWADFAAYGVAVATLAAALVLLAPRGQWPTLAALALTGATAWTLIEYLVHRFVLHGLEPFRSLHTLHHERPMALIGAPTLLSGGLIGLLVFLPTLRTTFRAAGRRRGLRHASRWQATQRARP